MAKGTGEAAEVAIQLWKPLAARLALIIGESGFISLYARSRYLTHTDFPWLASGDASHFADFEFAELKISLEGQNTVVANQASRMLLLTFTNILASFIGELLTTTILSSAWGGDAGKTASTGEEFSNE